MKIIKEFDRTVGKGYFKSAPKTSMASVRKFWLKCFERPNYNFIKKKKNYRGTDTEFQLPDLRFQGSIGAKFGTF